MNAQPKNSDPPKSEVETARPNMKSVVIDTATETRKISSQATKKKSQQAGASVDTDSFLESLGLEKYLTAFQVEEVVLFACT
ncbi:unnamed protein product [Eruca vesicaria subsp. sativa]|uniref:Uncharacterized protein n=1 Tax=Eruca vesicaria subsp. sativa TaxID=29727 RepID=A0ABC8KIK8_ERUVS|nr:unnamed protein product [Eruca vesicaria subsp. sativa]